MRAVLFLALLAALVALGCASVSRVQETRVAASDSLSLEAAQLENARIEYEYRGGRDFWDDEAEDEGLDSLQIEAKYFGGGK